MMFSPKDDDSFVDGVGRDISLGGMFVETEFPAPFNTEIVIHASFPGGEFVLPAIVRWTCAEGMGVQFRELGLRETQAISEIVYRFQAAYREARAG